MAVSHLCRKVTVLEIVNRLIPSNNSTSDYPHPEGKIGTYTQKTEQNYRIHRGDVTSVMPRIKMNTAPDRNWIHGKILTLAYLHIKLFCSDYIPKRHGSLGTNVKQI